MAFPNLAGCLEHLQAVVLLDGSVRPNPFAAAIGRSLLDLPIDSHRKLLGFWQSEVERFAEMAGIDRLPVRVIVDRSAPMPTQPPPIERVYLEIGHDPIDFRGSGGLLRDIAVDYDDDDYLLVSSGTYLLQEPLSDIAWRLADARGEVAIVSHVDGTPGGMLLVRCGCLRAIAPIGFVDMKEQGLPIIAAHHEVRVVHWDSPTGLPVRSPAAYLNALRVFHQKGSVEEREKISSPFAEDWRPTFAIIEPGAEVDPSAELLDSVVLAGARVGAGAAVVRSVLCRGAVVAPQSSVHGELLTAAA